jgi:hypothetical protein
MDGSIPSIRIQATKHNGKSATTRLGEQCLQYAVTPLAWAGAGQSIDVALKYTAPLPRMGSGPAARRGCCFFECYTFWAFQDYPFRKKKKELSFQHLCYATVFLLFALISYAQAQHPTGRALDGMPWEVKLHKKSNPHSNGFL